jgi:hypothetical protein
MAARPPRPSHLLGSPSKLAGMTTTDRPQADTAAAPTTPQPAADAVARTLPTYTLPTTDGANGRQRWQQRYQTALAKGQVRNADFTTLSGMEVEPGLRPERRAKSRRRPELRPDRLAGGVPLHARPLRTGYRGRTWTIRQFAGLRQRQADQRALQDDPRPRRRRPVRRLRHAHPHGPRLRRPDVPRRGRPLRRRHRQRRRHGHPLQRHQARRTSRRR